MRQLEQIKQKVEISEIENRVAKQEIEAVILVISGCSPTARLKPN